MDRKEKKEKIEAICINFSNSLFVFEKSNWFDVRADHPKLGYVVRMVVASILPHPESGPNDHRKDAPPFTLAHFGNAPEIGRIPLRTS